jgi:DNA-binding transcriptional LysR family regulator
MQRVGRKIPLGQSKIRLIIASMPTLGHMLVFVKVAKVGGFAGAARELHMSPPAVTRAIASLEESIGTRLLIRSTRCVKLTEPGTRYFEDCCRILADITLAESLAAGSFAIPTGTLAVSAPIIFGQKYVLPILMDYLDSYPKVIGNAIFVDRIVNIVDEGVDVAVRIGHLPDSNHSAVLVGSVRQMICGSPNYFEKRGVPQTPSDLVGHRIVAATSAWASLDWSFGTNHKITVSIHPQLFCSNYESLIAAALQGWGLARVVSYQVASEVQSGSLQAVLTDYEQEPLPIHVIHSEGRHASAKVRTFVDLVVERLRNNHQLS